MTDELAERRKVKRDPEQAKYDAQLLVDPVLAAAHAKASELAQQLRPHGPAIIELLNAIAIAVGQIAPGAPEQTQFGLLWNAAQRLGISDRAIMVSIARLHGVEGTDIPSSFSFELGGNGTT